MLPRASPPGRTPRASTTRVYHNDSGEVERVNNGWATNRSRGGPVLRPKTSEPHISRSNFAVIIMGRRDQARVASVGSIKELKANGACITRPFRTLDPLIKSQVVQNPSIAQ